MPTTYYPSINLPDGNTIPAVTLTEKGEEQMFDLDFALIAYMTSHELSPEEFLQYDRKTIIYDTYGREIDWFGPTIETDLPDWALFGEDCDAIII